MVMGQERALDQGGTVEPVWDRLASLSFDNLNPHFSSISVFKFQICDLLVHDEWSWLEGLVVPEDCPEGSSAKINVKKGKIIVWTWPRKHSCHLRTRSQIPFRQTTSPDRSHAAFLPTLSKEAVYFANNQPPSQVGSARTLHSARVSE
jgi:hypothetical protein